MYQCVSNYTINKTVLLGKGGFGSVYLTTDEKNQQYACKIIKLNANQNSNKLRLLIERELSIMSQLNDSSIVKLIQQFYDGQFIYIIMEYCNQGNLKQKIRATFKSSNRDIQFLKKKQEEMAIDVFWQLLKALEYLYSKNIIHRDIKLENILIHNGKCKLADFGLSRFLIDIDEEPMNSILGTPCYSSPQLLKQQNYTSKTDIWSFGILLYEIARGELPFTGVNNHDLLRNIENKLKTNYLLKQLENIENVFLQYLISQMLIFDEGKRIGLKDLIDKSHTFTIQENFKLQHKSKVQIPLCNETEHRIKAYTQKNHIQKFPTTPIPKQSNLKQQHLDEQLSTYQIDQYIKNKLMGIIIMILFFTFLFII